MGGSLGRMPPGCLPVVHQIIYKTSASDILKFKVNCGFKTGLKSTCVTYQLVAVVQFVHQRAPTR